LHERGSNKNCIQKAYFFVTIYLIGTTTGYENFLKRESIMMKVFMGGAVGTGVMTFMMCFVRPIIVGEPMGIAAKIGAMMGNNGALGMVIQLMIGAIFVLLVYAMIFMNFFLTQLPLKEFFIQY
jgi:hypothetical protein